MTIDEVLTLARERISDPARWIQGRLAEEEDGTPTTPHAKGAVRWCADGAMFSVSRGEGRSSYWEASGLMHRVCMERAGQPLRDFNDTHTHAEVLAVLDRAIEMSKEACAAV